jgi:hypothetical protein
MAGLVGWERRSGVEERGRVQAGVVGGQLRGPRCPRVVDADGEVGSCETNLCVSKN